MNEITPDLVEWLVADDKVMTEKLINSNTSRLAVDRLITENLRNIDLLHTTSH